MPALKNAVETTDGQTVASLGTRMGTDQFRSHEAGNGVGARGGTRPGSLTTGRTMSRTHAVEGQMTRCGPAQLSTFDPPLSLRTESLSRKPSYRGRRPTSANQEERTKHAAFRFLTSWPPAKTIPVFQLRFLGSNRCPRSWSRPQPFICIRGSSTQRCPACLRPRRRPTALSRRRRPCPRAQAGRRTARSPRGSRG